jgi:plastocyanin
MTSRAKLLAMPAVALATVAIAACGGSTGSSNTTSRTSSAAANLIKLKNIKFVPGVLHIARGDSVTWKWEDADIDTQHNVTSTGAKHFKNSPTQMSGTYTITFATAETYTFECTIHPASMQGKIIVG